MEDYSAASYVLAYTRFSCVNGHCRVLMIDAGSNVENASLNMEINWLEVGHKLHLRVKVEVCPVGDHHQHGKVRGRSNK